MHKPDKVPVIDITKCTNCDKCVKVCSSKVICKKTNYECSKCIKYCLSIKAPCNPDHYIFCYEKCSACGFCVSICPVNAINWFKILK